jgi:hypothetical protein
MWSEVKWSEVKWRSKVMIWGEVYYHWFMYYVAVCRFMWHVVSLLFASVCYFLFTGLMSFNILCMFIFLFVCLFSILCVFYCFVYYFSFGIYFHFPIFVQVYGPLTPCGNPIAVYKYIIYPKLCKISPETSVIIKVVIQRLTSSEICWHESDRPRPTTLLPPRSNGKPVNCSLYAPDDGQEHARNMLSCI